MAKEIFTCIIDEYTIANMSVQVEFIYNSLSDVSILNIIRTACANEEIQCVFSKLYDNPDAAVLQNPELHSYLASNGSCLKLNKIKTLLNYGEGTYLFDLQKVFDKPAKIANLSDLPCTISECTLSVDGYAESISSLRVNIRESYEVNDTYSISNRMCLSLPLTIPPLGYAEGFIVFPFGPSYKEDILHVEFMAKTARKDFMIYDTIKRYSSFCADGVEIFE